LGGPGVEAYVADPAEVAEPRLERRRVFVALAGALVGAGALAAVAIVNGDDFEDALELLTWQAVVALAVLHLIALIFRAVAWNLCLRAAEREAPPAELHASSSARFLADTVVPTYIGAWVRIGLLRRMLGDRSPTVGQMLLADVVLLLVEGGITIVLAVLVTFTADVDWWWPLIPAALAGLGLWGALAARKRFADRPFVRVLDVLGQSRRLWILTGLLTVVLVLQPIRFAIALDALGYDASAVEAMGAFLVTSIFGALPIGPSPASAGATQSVLGGDAGAAVAMGVVLAGTAVIAAVIYVAVSWPAYLAERRRSAESREVPSEGGAS
jgi:lysylphosphatidylglycerol synthase-like protein